MTSWSEWITVPQGAIDLDRVTLSLWSWREDYSEQDDWTRSISTFVQNYGLDGDEPPWTLPYRVESPSYDGPSRTYLVHAQLSVPLGQGTVPDMPHPPGAAVEVRGFDYIGWEVDLTFTSDEGVTARAVAIDRKSAVVTPTWADRPTGAELNEADSLANLSSFSLSEPDGPVLHERTFNAVLIPRTSPDPAEHRVGLSYFPLSMAADPHVPPMSNQSVRLRRIGRPQLLYDTFEYRYSTGPVSSWRLRQRQSLLGSDGRSLRQRHNGNHPGTWPLRQRQQGI